MTPTMSATRSRDVAIDVIRGLCIVSMAFAHLALGSLGWQITHAAVWIDGAEGFVFLSGLVLGITQRRVVDGAGPKVAAVKLLKRARLVYFGHLALALLAILMVQVSVERATYYSGLDQLGGPLPALASLLLLRVNPVDASILSLYVVMMLLALGAIWLLRRGAWPVVAGVSLMLFGAGTMFPSPFVLPSAPGHQVGVNWATWQLLFLLALCIGWNWTAAGVQRLRSSRVLLLCCSAAVALLVLVARMASRGAPAVWKSTLAGFFTDANLGIGRVVLGVAALVVLYHLAGLALRHLPVMVAPLATLGRRSLDCYLILSCVVLCVPAYFTYRHDLGGANLVVLAVLAACWGWCSMRDRVTGRLSGDRVADAGGCAVENTGEARIGQRQGQQRVLREGVGGRQEEGGSVGPGHRRGVQHAFDRDRVNGDCMSPLSADRPRPGVDDVRSPFADGPATS